MGLLLFFISTQLFTAILHCQDLNTTLLHNLQYEIGVNDIWGYSTQTGQEFAIVGTDIGTSIVRVTSNEIFEVGFIPGGQSLWRDVKVWDNYLYIGTENTNGGIQVVSLEDPFNPELITTWDGIGGSHNIMVHDGFLYIIGAEGGDMFILSLENPDDPQLVGIWEGDYLHDICFFENTIYGCGISSHTMYAIDVSDKHNPYTENYWTNVPSAHACWVSEDGETIATASETQGGHIMIWDVSELDNVELLSEWAPEGSEEKSAHNVFIKGDYLYISYYVYGLQIVDISNPSTPELAGYYDTYPGNEGLFNGAWGTYPFQMSCNIYISDRETGLYVIHFTGCTGADPYDPLPPQDLSSYSDYLSPETIFLNWNNSQLLYNGDVLNSYNIEIFRDSTYIETLGQNINQYVDTGLTDGTFYTYQLRTIDTETDSTSGFSLINQWAGGHPVPNSPTWISADGMVNQAILQWQNPNTQEDGSPLDDLEYIIVRRNGSILDSLVAIPGVTMEYIDIPPSGYRYTYELSSLDNEDVPNESELTPEKTVFVGEIPAVMIWAPTQNLSEDAWHLKMDLESVNQSVMTVSELTYFADTIPHEIDAVFSLLGIFPNDYSVNEIESQLLLNFLEYGGSLYLEGGDWWYENNNTELFNYFGINLINDGSDDLSSLTGFDQSISENLEFTYTGENNWIDQIHAVSPSFPIVYNDDIGYTAMVGNSNGNAHTIGSSFQVTGLEPPESRLMLLTGILSFFQNGIGHSWQKGDINADNNVNILDIVYNVEFMLEMTSFLPDQFWKGDMNHDDQINIQDILLMVQDVLFTD